MQGVEDNLKLVHYTLRKHFPQFINTQDYEDVFQVGCIGLVKACDNFDESLGFKFTTYAVSRIWGEIKTHLRDKYNMTHLYRKDAEALPKVKKAMYEFFNKNNRYPTAKEIYVQLGLSLNETFMLMGYTRNVFSLDSDISNLNSNSLGFDGELHGSSNISDGRCLDEEANLRLEIKKALSLLEPNIAKSFVLYYVKGLSQPKIAKVLGISQVSASRYIRKAKDELAILLWEYDVA